MMKRAGVPEGTARRSRISATHGIAVVGGTGLLALSRKLGEPWQSVLALASPALSFIGAALFAAMSTWFDRWHLAQEAREVERRLTHLKETAEALAEGPERSRIERGIQEIRESITEKQVRALKRIVGGEEPETVRAATARRRSR
jgi:hypothetical protein